MQQFGWGCGGIVGHGVTGPGVGGLGVGIVGGGGGCVFGDAGIIATVCILVLLYVIGM